MSNTKIITERLILRPFADGDLNDNTVLICDKMASEYPPYEYQWPTDDASMKDVLVFVMGEGLWRAVRSWYIAKTCSVLSALWPEQQTATHHP